MWLTCALSWGMVMARAEGSVEASLTVLAESATNKVLVKRIALSNLAPDAGCRGAKDCRNRLRAERIQHCPPS